MCLISRRDIVGMASVDQRLVNRVADAFNIKLAALPSMLPTFPYDGRTSYDIPYTEEFHKDETPTLPSVATVLHMKELFESCGYKFKVSLLREPDKRLEGVLGSRDFSLTKLMETPPPPIKGVRYLLQIEI
jgi:hypothetical protein